jgi:hypothetical protein
MFAGAVAEPEVPGEVMVSIKDIETKTLLSAKGESAALRRMADTRHLSCEEHSRKLTKWKMRRARHGSTPTTMKMAGTRASRSYGDLRRSPSDSHGIPMRFCRHMAQRT